MSAHFCSGMVVGFSEIGEQSFSAPIIGGSTGEGLTEIGEQESRSSLSAGMVIRFIAPSLADEDVVLEWKG